MRRSTVLSLPLSISWTTFKLHYDEERRFQTIDTCLSFISRQAFEFGEFIFDKSVLKNSDHFLGEVGRVNLFEPASLSISNSDNTGFYGGRVDDDDERNAEQVGRFIQLAQIIRLIRCPDLKIYQGAIVGKSSILTCRGLFYKPFLEVICTLQGLLKFYII
jgi:hypothetical protein